MAVLAEVLPLDVRRVPEWSDLSNVCIGEQAVDRSWPFVAGSRESRFLLRADTGGSARMDAFR
jgi:hypothetical protein